VISKNKYISVEQQGYMLLKLYTSIYIYIYIDIERERERERVRAGRQRGEGRDRERNANKSIPHCKQPTFGKSYMSIQLTKPELKVFLTSPGFCSSFVPKIISLTQNETLAL
jgi:hypothetical protein